MDKNEIVRKYKWFRVLRGILEMSFYMLFFFIIPVCISILMYIIGVIILRFLDLDVLAADKFLNMSFYITFGIIFFLELKNEETIGNFIISLSNHVTFSHHFEKKWGMTEEEIKEFISKQEEQEVLRRKEQEEQEVLRRKEQEEQEALRRKEQEEQEALRRKEQEEQEALRRKEQEEQKALRRKKREILGWNPVKYAFPFIREICKLNKGAKEVQEAILSDFLSKEEVEIIFDDFRKLGSLENAILCWRERSLPDRLSFMRFLFKLAILQDGIHNDEWNMLMNLIWQLRFNKFYCEDFRYRYFSLRTEFYDYERKSSTSTEDNSASTNNSSSSLKPYFTILGLEETASDDEIKRAYHKLALQHHPDMQKNADRIKECEAMMAKINEAYKKLRG